MTPFEIVMAVVVGMLIVWVLVMTFWCVKASKVVTQHKKCIQALHPNGEPVGGGGPPGDWPPGELDFP